MASPMPLEPPVTTARIPESVHSGDSMKGTLTRGHRRAMQILNTGTGWKPIPQQVWPPENGLEAHTTTVSELGHELEAHTTVI